MIYLNLLTKKILLLLIRKKEKKKTKIQSNCFGLTF